VRGHDLRRLGHADGLDAQGRGTGIGQAVRAADAAADHLIADQPHVALGGQPVQRRVERSGGEPDLAPGQLLGSRDDGVTMQRALEQAGSTKYVGSRRGAAEKAMRRTIDR